MADLIGKCNAALAALAKTNGSREDVHALRSCLSEICALAETDDGIMQAIDAVAEASNELAEIALHTPSLLHDTDLRAGRLRLARGSLQCLAQTLVGAQPSQIALSLNRAW